MVGLKIRSKDKYVAVDKNGRVVNRFTSGGLGGKLSALCYIRGDLTRSRQKMARARKTWVFDLVESGELRSNYDKVTLKTVSGGKPGTTVGSCAFSAGDGDTDYGTVCLVRASRTARGRTRVSQRVINPCEGRVGGQRDRIYTMPAAGQRPDKNASGMIIRGTRKRKSRKRRRR